MTSDPARAQDLAQETFIRAWRALGTYRGETGVSAWLRRIAINVVLGDDFRTQQGPDLKGKVPADLLADLKPTEDSHSFSHDASSGR